MPRNSAEYEEDFYAWTVEQAHLLRSGNFSAIDAANIAEEVESMGRSDRRELKSRLVGLIMHLLKWCHQPAARSRSWSATIDEQRLQIEGLIDKSPSLRPLAATMIPKLTRLPGRARLVRPGSRMKPFPGFAPLRRKRFCLRHSSRRDDRRRLELTRNSVDYEEDFYAWTVEQARLLRSGDLRAIDVANIAEEIESMGRSDRRAIESRLTVLLAHLLKWQVADEHEVDELVGHDPRAASPDRRALAGIAQSSTPCRRSFIGGLRRRARGRVEETGLPETEFPAECPFTVERGAVARFSAGALTG